MKRLILFIALAFFFAGCATAPPQYGHVKDHSSSKGKEVVKQEDPTPEPPGQPDDGCDGHKHEHHKKPKGKKHDKDHGKHNGNHHGDGYDKPGHGKFNRHE